MLTRRPLLQMDLSLPLLFIGLSLLLGLGTAIAVMYTGNPLILGAATAALVAGILVFLRPDLGLMLLLFVTFTRAASVVPFLREIPSVSVGLSILLGAFLIFRNLFIGEKIGNWQTPLLFFGSYAVIGLASLLWAAHPESVQMGLVVFLKDAILALAVAMSIRRLENLRQVVWALLAAGLFLGMISVLQTLTGNYENEYWGFGGTREMNIIAKTSGIRIRGPDMDPNSYGQYMVLLLPMALDRLWSERNAFLRTLALAAFVVITMTVIFTFSRSAFIMLVLSLGVFLIQHPPRPIFLVLGVLIIPVLWLFVPPQFTARISTLTYLLPGVRGDPDEETVVGVNVKTATQDVSFRGRLSENIVGLRMSMDHPILGVGLDNFKHHYLDYSSEIGLDSRRENRGAHNLYLEIWAELGLMGIAWFTALNWVALRGLIGAKLDLTWSGLRQYAGIASALTIALLTLLFGSLFRHLTYPTYFWLFYAIVLAVPYAVKRDLIGRQG